MRPTDFAQPLTTYACAKLQRNFRQIQRCTALLSEDEFWQRANQHSNSIGNLVVHLAGNIGQWIIGGVGRQPFERDRPAEFDRSLRLPQVEALSRLSDHTQRARAIIAGLSAAQLLEPRTIQAYRVVALTAVFHVVEHYSFHTGQIVYFTKILRNADLSAYDAAGRLIDDEHPDLP
ncbi:MAG: hypothetical protein CHACPFDD_03925 [Phycisphaerae bacterium]|nr:hypothetical protein [Phycisphaerae bacterium]